jgi:hypothetical protein
MRERIVRGAFAGLLLLGSLTGVACDKEDKRDAEQFGNQVEKGAEELGEEAENTIDNNIDTDGKDD